MTEKKQEEMVAKGEESTRQELTNPTPLWKLSKGIPSIPKPPKPKKPKALGTCTYVGGCQTAGAIICYGCKGALCSMHIQHCPKCQEAHCTKCHQVCHVEKWDKVWNIEQGFKLVSSAADFYLLERISAELDFETLTGEALAKAEKAMTDLYEPLLDHMQAQIVSYLEMVVGGELRHWHGLQNGVLPTFLASKVDDATRQEILELYDGHYVKSNLQRRTVWATWKGFVDKKGPRGAELATIIFRYGGWSGAIGGERWAKIAETVFRYRTGMLSVKNFVDTALGLQHNCNIVFDKVWKSQISDLKVVLDANLAGNMNLLQLYCSAAVKQVYGQVFPMEKTKPEVTAGKVMPTFGVEAQGKEALKTVAKAYVHKTEKANYILSLRNSCTVCALKSKKPCHKVHATYKPMSETWHCYKCQQAVPLKVFKLSDDDFMKKFALCAHCLATVPSSNAVVVGSVLPA